MGIDSLTSLVESAAKENQTAVKDALKQCFTALMMCHEEQVKKQLDKFIKRMQHLGENFSVLYLFSTQNSSQVVLKGTENLYLFTECQNIP